MLVVADIQNAERNESLVIPADLKFDASARLLWRRTGASAPNVEDFDPEKVVVLPREPAECWWFYHECLQAAVVGSAGNEPWILINNNGVIVDPSEVATEHKRLARPTCVRRIREGRLPGGWSWQFIQPELVGSGLARMLEPSVRGCLAHNALRSSSNSRRRHPKNYHAAEEHEVPAIEGMLT
jgi:hypothetical protein